MKLFVVIGSVLMMIGVGAGAFGAHGLSSYFSRYPNLEGTYETAVRYHIYHALGILFVAWAATQWPGNLTTWAGYLMLAGVIVFFRQLIPAGTHACRVARCDYSHWGCGFFSWLGLFNSSRMAAGVIRPFIKFM